jgi:hypothetical protein
MKSHDSEPSADLYNRVRAGFILQGLNLSTWCKKQGIHQSHAKGCLIGMWDGPKGCSLRNRLIEAANIDKIPKLSDRNHAYSHSSSDSQEGVA